jgi:hypothetical protein
MMNMLQTIDESLSRIAILAAHWPLIRLYGIVCHPLFILHPIRNNLTLVPLQSEFLLRS